jgi:hypothetical protein
MERSESVRYIADALRAYVERKPLGVETPPDWPLVVELASQNLVSPAVGLVLMRQPEVPNDVKEYFAAIIAWNRERNAALENAIRAIVAALNRSGMTPLLLKGAANLLDGLYPDPAARIIGDIDILVPADVVSVASRVLAAIVYRTVVLPPPPNRRWVMVTARHNHLPMQVNEEAGAGVELHYELVHLYLIHLINAKDATARALPRGRNGLRYLVLCPTDRVTHNIVHAQMHHPLQRKGLVDLRQMVDLALLIDECGGAIDWLEIRRRFASAGAIAVLHDQAAVLREMFGRDVPITVADTAATATRLRHAIAKSPTGFTTLRYIAAEYWALFRGKPLLAINLLNPLWWPQRIRAWRARLKR